MQVRRPEELQQRPQHVPVGAERAHRGALAALGDVAAAWARGLPVPVTR